MKDDFVSSKPIYLQLIDTVCRQIVRGERMPGSKLPSVRDLAVQVGVNPNTVQRVYMELEQLGVTETKRGQGTFVTEDAAKLRELREGMVRDRIQSFIADMTEMGVALDEILDGLRTRATLVNDKTE